MQKMGLHAGANWQVRLNDSCAAAAMQLSPYCYCCLLFIIECVRDNCSDLRNNRISVIEDGAFEGMHQLEEL